MKRKISISISRKLLANIERDVIGSSRSEKICKCAELGYQILTKQKPKEVGGIGIIVEQDIGE